MRVEVAELIETVINAAEDLTNKEFLEVLSAAIQWKAELIRSKVGKEEADEYLDEVFYRVEAARSPIDSSDAEG